MMAMQTLHNPTKRHRDQVAQVRSVWAALTRNPQASMRELQAATGLGSVAVQQAVQELVRQGYVRWPRRTARAAVVVVPLIERIPS
jgi:DNA-binding MarR family transcriptional regulator